MSDVFKQSIKPKKRDWFDWMSDNFGKVVIAAIVVNALFWGGLAWVVTVNAHKIAGEVGGLARAAADGYSKPSTSK